MGWPHLASCTNINTYVNEHCCAKSFSDTSTGNFHPGVICTAHEHARFWFLGIMPFPDNKSVQPQFIALHLAKEINVYFVCLKSTNSIKGMTDEILTQEFRHTFNHMCGRSPLEDWLCCPLRLVSEAITFNRNKNWPNLQVPLQAYGWQENSSISCRILTSAVHTEMLCPEKPTSTRTPCCKGQLAGSGYPAEHSLDPTKNSSIPVVLILLSLSNVRVWAKVTAGNGQSCLVMLKGEWQFGCVFPMHKYGKLQNSLMLVS